MTPAEPAGQDSPPAARPATAVLTDRLAAVFVNHEPGWRVPQASMLARRFNVGTAEVSSAIEELVARHFLRRLPDGRVFLAGPSDYLITVEGIPGIGAHIDPMGASVTCADRQVSWRRIPEDIATIFGLPAAAEASVTRCQWTVNGYRAALSTTYMAARQLTDLSAQEDPVSLDAALAHPTPAEYSAVPAAIQLEMQPPPTSVARVLHLAPGAPAMIVTVRFTDSAHTQTVALTTVVMRSDLFRVVIEPPAPGPPLGPAGVRWADAAGPWQP